uniref:Uncharacterized protein n=1 Tax=Rhodnius prolixus TaxID=13249 RepID=A0A905R0E8_RHOPR
MGQIGEKNFNEVEKSRISSTNEANRGHWVKYPPSWIAKKLDQTATTLTAGDDSGF